MASREEPIRTVGRVTEVLSPRLLKVDLPNGKNIFAHLPKRLAEDGREYSVGDAVPLEMTPFDFEKARVGDG